MIKTDGIKFMHTLMCFSMCGSLCGGVVYMYMQAHVQVRGQPQMPHLGHYPLLFVLFSWRTGTLQIGQSGCLATPKSWDEMYMSPHPASFKVSFGD